MKSFKDIEFKPHSFGEGVHGLLFFPNGYGVSVVRYKNPISKSFSSYTSNDSEWEVAIIYGNKKIGKYLTTHILLMTYYDI